MIDFDNPEVDLCDWQDVKVQLLINFFLWISGFPMSILASYLAWR